MMMTDSGRVPSGFDPSRVTRVERHAGTTCTHFVGGVFTTFSDPGTFRIYVGSQAWFFEWSDRFGALRVGPRGETREQPGLNSPFWRATALWPRQGKRTESIGKRVRALWDDPPPVTHYYEKRGRQRFVLRTDQPEGYDPLYSEERYIAQKGSDNA
jgi:hypothetical protein